MNLLSTCLTVLVAYLALILLTPTDSTDASKWGRSGMVLRIDNLTGCHYLETAGALGIFTSVTPRLDKNGDQICTGE